MMKVLNFAFAVTSLISITPSFASARPIDFQADNHNCAIVPANWTYGLDNAGPQDWGKLDPSYKTCSTGHQQSPIDLSLKAYVKVQKQPISDLTFPPLHDVQCGYTGHYVECLYNSTNANNAYTNTNSIVIGGKTYNLSNFHFHVSSEHRLNNQFADGEFHMVYLTTPTGNEAASEAVIAVLLDAQPEDNPFFSWISSLDKMPDKEQIKYLVKRVDFEGLLHDTGRFTPRWEYIGSVTTPPCTEGVNWNVAQRHVNIGLDQLRALQNLQGFSARFLQDRHNRHGHAHPRP